MEAKSHSSQIHAPVMCDAPGDSWEVSMVELICLQCAVLNGSMEEACSGELAITKFAKWLSGYHW